MKIRITMEAEIGDIKSIAGSHEAVADVVARMHQTVLEKRLEHASRKGEFIGLGGSVMYEALKNFYADECCLAGRLMKTLKIENLP